MEVIHRGQFGEVLGIAPIFKGKKDGFYVDVGAHDGVTDSNTLHFEQLGWRGICIEPHQSFYPQLVKNRPRATCLDCAIWDEELESVDFHVTAVGGWSRIGGPLPNADHRIVGIQHPHTRILNNVLQEYDAPAPFDLLSVDVEGTEWHILNGFNLDKYRPRIVIIEDLERKKQFDTFFKGYTGVYSYERGINRCTNVIYCLRKEDAEIVKNGWGRNL